ncbi:hydrogenase expression/formation protein, partial [Candidatus Methanophagaceae archaeon]
MDLEGFAKRKLRAGDTDAKIIAEMSTRIEEIKRTSIITNTTKETADKLAKAVLEEAKRTLDLKDEFATEILSGVRMGEMGVGSRGSGDFYVHEKIGELIGATGAVVDSSSLSD